MDTRIEPGCCKVCGEPVAEILAVYAQGHPLKGHVLQVGKVLPDIYKVTMTCLNGADTSILIHETDKDINLNDIWHRMCEATALDFAKAPYQPNYNAELKEKAYQNQIKLDSPPIGILDIESVANIYLNLLGNDEIRA